MDAHAQLSQGARDASVLQRIFTGHLQSSSIVEETADLKQVVLAEHPHYSKVLQLARKASAIETLGSPGLLEGVTPKWTESLEEMSFAKIAFRLFKQQATGFAVVQHKDRRRVIALSAGLPISATSNIPTERFGNFLLMRKAVTQPIAEQAHALCRQSGTFLGTALLELGIFSTDELNRYLEEYTRLRLFPVFGWSHGKVDFFPDARAMVMTPVINLSFMGIMRAGIWGNRPLDLPSVKLVSQHLLQTSTNLLAPSPLGTLEWELSDIERMVTSNLMANKRLESVVIELLEPGQQAKALLGAYILVQMGALETQNGHEPQPSGAHYVPLQSQSQKHRTAELDSYLERQRVESIARRQLVTGRPQEAQDLFQELYNKDSSSPDIMAYLAMATLMSNPKRNINRAFTMAKKAIGYDPKNAIAHATMSRCFDTMGKESSATSHRQKAIELSGNNRDWQAEIITLLNVGIRTTSPVVLHQEGTPLPGIFLALVTMGILFFASNILGHGEFEHQYVQSDYFFFARRLALIGVAIIGLCAFERANPIQVLIGLFERFPVRYALYALIWGIAVGYCSPMQDIRGEMIPVLGMGLLHVFADEIFFRGMLTRLFLKMSPSPTVAIALSALIFGLYQLTYASLWINLTIPMKLYWMGLIAVAAGLPFAWLYSRTKTIGASLIAYGIAHIFILWVSLFSNL